jgi:plastocyanin
MGWRLIAATAMASLAAACGSNDNGMAPSPAPAGSTITITSSGVSPKNLVVSPGTQVTFMNNDSRNHEMTSDPHPEHTECPAINTVDLVVPGMGKQTSNLNVVRTCGYHDHLNPENAMLRGTITIQ